MRNERERLIEELLAEKAEVLPPTLKAGPDCPAITDLMDVALGEAGPEMVGRIKQHSEQCSPCRARLAVYGRTLDEEETDEKVVPGSLLDRVARRVAGKVPFPADSAPIVEERASRGTHDTSIPARSGKGLTSLANAGKWPQLREQLRPWLPLLLGKAGLDDVLAEDFLAFLEQRLPELGSRRFREALPGWIAAFAWARDQADRLRPLPAEVDAGLLESLALERSLRQPSANEPAWAETFRQVALRESSSVQALLELEVPAALAGQFALPLFRRGLVQQALQWKHEALQAFELT
jgi:hypothetical protein